MDDCTDGDIFLLADAKRFHHVGFPFKPFADVGLYGIGGYVVRLDADNLAHFRDDGAVWEESAVYCYPEIITQDWGLVCPALSVEGNCVFHGTIDDFPDFPKGGLARILNRVDGVLVHHFTVFFQQTVLGSGNGGNRSADGRGYVADESLIFLRKREEIVENIVCGQKIFSQNSLQVTIFMI